ncbi:MAG TPA: ABC transporter permease [Candidatus Acidoferrum sp.]|nr:ABC transporter permease [Candidatus Acidoferrum sp.]
MLDSLRQFAARLRSFFSPRSLDNELESEMATHLQFATEENLRRGMAPQEAARQARISFGGPQQSKESHRDSRSFPLLEFFLRDFLIALRTLRNSPGFTAAAVLTLALGIGANSAIFSVASGVLFRDLPFKEPRRLVLLWSTSSDSARDQLSFTDLDDYRSQNHSLEDIVPFGTWSATFLGNGTPERIDGVQVGDGYFSLLGANFRLGRGFLPEEQVPGKDQVLVLTYELWQRRFAADESIVGKQVRLGSKQYSVVGVTARDFPVLPPTLVDGHPQFYRPVAETHDDNERRSRHLRAIARLKAGVSLQPAQTDLSLINRRLAAQFPNDYSTVGVRVTSLHDDLSSGFRPALFVLSGAIGFLLLIACANVANLLLARAIGRQNELAIRSAVGARRSQIVRQMLIESLALACFGGAAGIAFAAVATKLAVVLGARVIPQLLTVSLDARVLVFTAALSLATGFVFGSLPAWQASAVSANDTLRAGNRGTTTAHLRLRNILAVTEIALALVLLAGAGLLIRSFAKLYSVDRGFRTDHLLTMDVSLPSSRYPEGTPKPAQFYRNLISRVSALPGVASAGAVSILPLGTNFDTAGTEPEGLVHGPGETPYPERYIVSPGYFSAIGIRLVKGRLLSESDTDSSPLVALVSQTAARRWWPGQDPIGKHIMPPGFDSNRPPWRTVVGVVQDVKQAGLDAPATAQIYLPHSQYATGSLTLVVHSSVAPLSLTSPVRQQLLAIDPEIAASNITTMEEVLSNSIASQRFSTALLGALAGLGLILSSIGIYGVLSYGVLQRTREIGIRMTLGATNRRIVSLVMGHGVKILAVGLAVGFVAALFITRLMSSLLFGVTANDPLTYVGIFVFLSFSALLACYLPARRASRLNPLVALRHE